MMCPSIFSKDDEIINIGMDKFLICNNFTHFFLKNVWAIAESHREALIFILAPGKHNGA